VGKKILIAYATRYGSTGEVAQAVGKVLQEAGAEVDVLNIQDIKDITPYQGVIIGSAARLGKLYASAIKFVNKHAKDLVGIPTAYFYVGTIMNQDTLENRKKAGEVLEPLRRAKEPISIGFFGGKVDPTKLEPFWRFIVSFVKEGEMAPGDHRDWNAVNAWAKSLIPILIKT
jgi:menaquinone-dependent protoporphyrinogen oxidase